MTALRNGAQTTIGAEMKIREIMTGDPACCSSGTSLMEAARLMSEHDCGELPVLDDHGRPIGVVTDRDIACRGVAQGKGKETPVREVMSSPVVTATPETDLEDCCKALEQNQIRRIPLVNAAGTCCGIVSQADIAQHAPEHDVAQVVRDVSRRTPEASRVGCC